MRRRAAPTGLIHGPWRKNPKAPSSLWDGLVLDGAYAGLHPGTNRFVDGSGLENHGTLTNMDAASDWVWSEEICRGGIRFDSGSERIEVAKSDALKSSGELSISAWYTADVNLAGQVIALYGRDIPTAEYGWYVGASGVFRLLARISSGSAADTMQTAENAYADDGTYRHVTAVWPGVGATAVLYANGVPSVTTTQSVVPQQYATLGLCIGNSANVSRDWRGTISDMLIHSRPLLPAEIEWLADPAHRMYEPDTRRQCAFPRNPIAMLAGANF